MTIANKTTMDYINTASTQVHEHRIRNASTKVGRFILRLLEMLVAMMAGMPDFFMLRNQIPASSIYAAAFIRGTILYDLAIAVFMTVPMVAWMIFRGHGRRHSIEMAVAMSAPFFVINVLRLFGVNAPWFQDAEYTGMFLGMIAAMLYRRDHYSGKAGHSAHATHQTIS